MDEIINDFHDLDQMSVIWRASIVMCVQDRTGRK